MSLYSLGVLILKGSSKSLQGVMAYRRRAIEGHGPAAQVESGALFRASLPDAYVIGETRPTAGGGPGSGDGDANFGWVFVGIETPSMESLKETMKYQNTKPVHSSLRSA